MAEIKPCPFCGGEAELERNAIEIIGLGDWANSSFVSCTQCGAAMFSFDGIESPVEAWNRRANETDRR